MSEASGGGQNERLGVALLLTEALRRIGEAPGRFALLWAVWSGVSLAIEFGAQAAGIPATTDPTPASLGRTALDLAVTSLAATLTLRLALHGPWLRLDRGALECAGLLALLNVAVLAVSYPMSGTVGAPSLRLALMLAGFVGFVALIVVSFKLLLWPIGRLTGRTEVTARRSWVLMRGALRGYLLASLLTAVPIGAVFVAGVVALGPQMAETPGGLVILTVAYIAWVILGEVMAAVIFARRVNATANLAAVFD